MAGTFRTLAGSGAVTVALLALAPSGVAGVLDADRAVARDCSADRLAPGASGVAHESFRAPETGLLTVNLDGAAGDWGLGLFAAGDGEAVAASTGFGPLERAEVWVARGETLTAQGCRRHGLSGRADLGFDQLFGDAGSDDLAGGPQLDTLRGGPGRDFCRDDGEDDLRGCRPR